MARAPVSKTEYFSLLIKERSEKTAKFSPSSINRLGRVSERHQFLGPRPAGEQPLSHAARSAHCRRR